MCIRDRWKIHRIGKLFPHAAVRVRVKIKDRVKFRVRVRSRVQIRVRIRARVEVKVSVSVSYIMTIWRWEEFSMCDKFPTTPALTCRKETTHSFTHSNIRCHWRAGMCDAGHDGGVFVWQPAGDRSSLWPRVRLATCWCGVRRQRAYLSWTTSRASRHWGLTLTHDR